MDFSGKKNVDIFEKWIHFLILWIVLKNETSLQSGGLRPRTPCGGGRVIAFKWPGRPPPPKKSWRRHWLVSNHNKTIFKRSNFPKNILILYIVRMFHYHNSLYDNLNFGISIVSIWILSEKVLFIIFEQNPTIGSRYDSFCFPSPPFHSDLYRPFPTESSNSVKSQLGPTSPGKIEILLWVLLPKFASERYFSRNLSQNF